ncbi:S9 family peptidase [Balneola sp. MJW-20]|uniref:S9 family peptidase n=1 Tax=Gracilimonas aurantiaca TaxID=3234185 RepID=UPI0034667A21
MKKHVYFPFFLILMIAVQPLVLAQQKVLTIDDYTRWSQIRGTQISNNGQWMAYSLRPNGGDDTLHVTSLNNDTKYIIPNASGVVFSNDNKYAAYSISPDEDTRENLRSKNQPVHTKAELLDLSTGEKIQVERMNSMTFSEDGRFWAVHREKPDDDKSKHSGSDLVVRDLSTGVTQNYGNVSEFSFNKRSDHLAYLVDAAEMIGNGVYLKNLSTGSISALDSDSTRYRDLSWDDEDAHRSEWMNKGRSIAVLKGTKVDSLLHIDNTLMVFDPVTDPGRKLSLSTISIDAFEDEMVISEDRDLSWSSDGNLIMIGLKEQGPVIKVDRDTVANVDVFHWKDDRIQTVQERQANRDRNFTWLATYNTSNVKVTPVTRPGLKDAEISDHSRYMVVRDEEPYINDVNWGVSPADLYRVNILTGDRDQFASNIKRDMGYSPDGRYFLYQSATEQDTALIVYDLEEGTNTNISEASETLFMDMDHPYPHENPPFGIAGWTADGDYVIVNHKYDLWMLALDGSEATNITRGIGDEEEIRFRYLTMDPDEEYIDLSKDLMLTAFGKWTKKDGFYALRMGREPRELRFEDASFGRPMKARDADRVIVTRQTFVDFPDYYLTDTRFRRLNKVTDANPQQSEYAWGKRVLIEYENDRGIKLQGTLALPANYEEGKKYPMIVYFYEQMSDRHHQYSMPVYDDRPHMSTYASNGYLVLMPDNVYEEGRPGTSSLDCITAATQKVIDLGYADPDKIGLQGHSWGGYQSSFILTQTDMFATVVTGAPPTNLTGFYNNIYGNTGTNHHGIMEIGQVRMGRGVTPWTHREIYNRENPMFYVPDIETPFMILHGTADGAVDWSQGLEFYNAARRMGKEVVFLSYPDEPHHLRREANQIDFQIRMKQWFDHYVIGAPAADWMQNGIPYLEKRYLLPED